MIESVTVKKFQAKTTRLIIFSVVLLVFVGSGLAYWQFRRNTTKPVNKTKTANEYYREGLFASAKNDNDKSNVYVLLASDKLRAGKKQEALKDYNTAISLNDKNISAYQARAELYDQISNKAAAIKDVEKVKSLTDKSNTAVLTQLEKEIANLKNGKSIYDGME